MKKIQLVISVNALGDSIIQFFPIIFYIKKIFKKFKLQIDVFAASKEIQKLLIHHPEIHQVHDLRNWNFDSPKDYDYTFEIITYYCYKGSLDYISVKILQRKQIVYHQIYSTSFFDSFRLKGIKKIETVPYLMDAGFKEEDVEFDLNWYNEFKTEYNFTKNTILFQPNKKDRGTVEQYNNFLDIYTGLTKAGYNVIKLNQNKDIRNNLFLIQASPIILSVDTGLIWLCTILRKKVELIVSHVTFNHYLGQEPFLKKNYDNVSMIPAKDIVQKIQEKYPIS